MAAVSCGWFFINYIYQAKKWGNPGYDVVTALSLAVAQYGVPERLQVDNGPEFISKEVGLWAYAQTVVLDFSRPGKPTDNAFIESFEPLAKVILKLIY